MKPEPGVGEEQVGAPGRFMRCSMWPENTLSAVAEAKRKPAMRCGAVRVATSAVDELQLNTQRSRCGRAHQARGRTP
jgi:hypothetical protein